MIRRYSFRRFALLAAIAALGTPAGAAEKMTTAYSSLTTATALKVAEAALAECQKKGYVVGVAVVDRGGAPLALLRDNLAGAHTPSTAIGKAWTAVSFRTDTSELLARTEPGKPSAGIRELPNVVVLGGGLQIMAKGVLLGAVGVSGAPGGDIDDACGKAGIKAVSDNLELE
ncbi:MAG TPA: heme-binding protein [Rhodocyclaceae bacterium]|nr:heme-binding protein [Rhodocyclaceae bacterium]